MDTVSGISPSLSLSSGVSGRSNMPHHRHRKAQSKRATRAWRINTLILRRRVVLRVPHTAECPGMERLSFSLPPSPFFPPPMLVSKYLQAYHKFSKISPSILQTCHSHKFSNIRVLVPLLIGDFSRREGKREREREGNTSVKGYPLL